MRYVQYARKSSEGDERQVQSIPDQEAVLSRLAQQLGLDVRYKLTEAHSAKQPGTRAVFQEMIGLINAGKADGILCWHVNRLSRNPVDSGMLSWLLQQGVLKSIRTPDREYRSEDNVVIMAVENAVANQFVVDLRNNIRRAQREKAARGWYPRKPPGGYFTNRDTGQIEVDPERFPKLRKAWELMLTEAYSVPEVHSKLAKWGYRTRLGKGRAGKMMTESNLYKMFDNRFYLGEFIFEGETHLGRHQPMVTPEEFGNVQSIIHRDDPVAVNRHFFPFTGLIRCGGCGCMVTAETKVKHYKATNRTVSYTYYRCTRRRGRCKQPAVRGEVIKEAISEVLRKCHLDDEACEWARQALSIEDDDFATFQEVIAQIEKDVEFTERKLAGLLELRLAGEISAEEMASAKAGYQSALQELRTKAERLTYRRERRRETVDNLLAFVSHAEAAFAQGDDKIKREIASVLGQSYVLTLGRLDIQVHPLLEPLTMFEPPKTAPNMVRPGITGPDFPFLCPQVEHIRTSLASEEAMFPKLNCLHSASEGPIRPSS